MLTAFWPFLAEHLLSIIVATPVAAAFALGTLALTLRAVGLGDLPSRAWLGTAFVATVLTFAATVWAAVLFDPERLGLQGLEARPWVPALGATVAFAVDGIGLCFLLSTAAVSPLALIASRDAAEESEPAWVFVILALESALLGAIASSNLLFFIGFWAAGLVPLLLWMGRWGGLGRARAASRLWTTEAIGLAGMLFVAFVLHEATLAQFGVASLDLAPREAGVTRSLLDVRLEVDEQWLLFLAFSFALATRLPIAPLHFWLPAAHAAAPTGLSVLIATGFAQTAAIGWLRFALPLFPDAVRAAGPALSLLGIVALAYASLLALVQKELKRLVAYASVGYAGFALFGMSTLNVQGLTGAVLQLLTHGLATAGLFTLIGFLSIRRGTTEVAAFGGLAKPMPVCAFFFGVMVLSLMGLPLLGGFVGDLFVLLGSLETRRTLSVFALIAMVVAASYLLWVQRRLFLGPVEEPANRGLIDLDRIERAILLALTIPIVAIGIHPNPVLRRVEPAVLELLYEMDRRSVAKEIPAPEAESDDEEFARVDRVPSDARVPGKGRR